MPFGRPERCKCCAAAPHNLHKRCRSLFLGVQACRLAGLKGVNPAQRLLAKALPWPFSWGFKLACGRHDSCTLCAAAPHLAKVLPWPPTVPAESFLGGSSVPFGSAERCKPCAAAPHSFHKRCRGHQLCRQSLFWGVQACRLAGLKGVNPAQRLHAACKSVAMALFLGVSSLPFGRPERFHCCAAAPHNLHKCCRGHQLWRQILFLGVSSLPFGRPERCKPCAAPPAACKSNAVALFLGVQACMWQARQL